MPIHAIHCKYIGNLSSARAYSKGERTNLVRKLLSHAFRVDKAAQRGAKGGHHTGVPLAVVALGKDTVGDRTQAHEGGHQALQVQGRPALNRLQYGKAIVNTELSVGRGGGREKGWGGLKRERNEELRRGDEDAVVSLMRDTPGTPSTEEVGL